LCLGKTNKSKISIPGDAGIEVVTVAEFNPVQSFLHITFGIKVWVKEAAKKP
jgi:hypothetical protein